MLVSIPSVCVWIIGTRRGGEYQADVVCWEEDVRPSLESSGVFGSLLGDIGYCMQVLEEGRVMPFGGVLDRVENR